MLQSIAGSSIKNTAETICGGVKPYVHISEIPVPVKKYLPPSFMMRDSRKVYRIHQAGSSAFLSDAATALAFALGLRFALGFLFVEALLILLGRDR